MLNVTINFTTSPLLYSGYFLFSNAAQKMYMTNYGINFFLYVISGQKFRTDLKSLFSCVLSITKTNGRLNSDLDDQKTKFSSMEKEQIKHFDKPLTEKKITL